MSSIFWRFQKICWNLYLLAVDSGGDPSSNSCSFLLLIEKNQNDAFVITCVIDFHLWNWNRSRFRGFPDKSDPINGRQPTRHVWPRNPFLYRNNWNAGNACKTSFCVQVYFTPPCYNVRYSFESDLKCQPRGCTMLRRLDTSTIGFTPFASPSVPVSPPESWVIKYVFKINLNSINSKSKQNPLLARSPFASTLRYGFLLEGKCLRAWLDFRRSDGRKSTSTKPEAAAAGALMILNRPNDMRLWV